MDETKEKLEGLEPKDILLKLQDIFDGKQTVEDFIDKNKVTIEQGKNLELIRRHI